MKSHLIILLFLILSIADIEGQVTSPTRFEVQAGSQNNKEAFLLGGLPNNLLIMFWHDSTTSQLKSSKSTDGGFSWNPASVISTFTPQGSSDINSIVLNTGRILLTYRSAFYFITYSDDLGSTWSSAVSLPTAASPIFRRRAYYSSLSKNSDGAAAFTYSYSNTIDFTQAKGVYNLSSPDGITWSSADTIDINGKNGQIIGLGNNKDIVVYQDSTNDLDDIFYRASTNAGISWSERNWLAGGLRSQTNARGVKDQNGKLWIYYNHIETTPFNDIFQSNIYYITSNDDGNSWSPPEKFTKYVGDDNNHKVSLWNGRPIISFNSTRNYDYTNSYKQIYFTLADLPIDLNVLPFLYRFLNSNEDPYPNQPYSIQAYVDDDGEVVSVKMNTYTDPPGTNATVEMYDDGAHNDSSAGDNIYGVEIVPQNFGDFFSYYFLVEDNQSNIATFGGSAFTVPLVFATDAYLFDVNEFKLPIDNRGILADVLIDGQKGGRFEESSVLFSGGFYLSGLNNGAMWANGIASASNVEDYQAGPVGSQPTDPYNKLYIVKRTDPPFGDSWIVYQNAVQKGASFYDGNDDGEYIPFDLNGNNQWDPNEDRPDFIGDVTGWCVYNDGVPSNVRRWTDSQPMGIEVHQTVFAYGEYVLPPIDKMIFVRYRIFNIGTVANKFDDVYFSCWSDPDLGQSGDDLVGCDTQLDLGYTYQIGIDPLYGPNAPALGMPFLQGPAAYILNETFIDQNGNGLYDDGIDTPLDSAYMRNGPIMGITTLPGAKNQELSSFIHYMNGDPNVGDPNFSSEARYYMLGLNRFGVPIDPCNWPYGQVIGTDCNNINPKYLYSGDPVNVFGWLNTAPTDQRMLSNTGPFTLEVDKPVDIIVGYVVGRGTDGINSVAVMKNFSAEAINIYQSNFTNIPTGIENEPVAIREYELDQNYPNPFNPTTKINYAIPQNSFVEMKVFNLLGQEIVTLVNQEKTVGTYEVNFNASNLPSGVYIYKMKAGEYVETKKMVLLK